MSIVTFSSAWRAVARRLLPATLRRHIWQGIYGLDQHTTSWRLGRLRQRMLANQPRTFCVERFIEYTIRIADGPNYYMQYKDESIRCIYHFERAQPDPLIIDGGVTSA